MKTRGSYFEHEGQAYFVLSSPLRRPVTFERLTAAELDVAEGVLAGLSMRSIALRRGVSERTIANQLARVYRKLAVGCRHELIALVAELSPVRKA